MARQLRLLQGFRPGAGLKRRQNGKEQGSEKTLPSFVANSFLESKNLAF
jgi:hypothetical protein